MNPSPMKLVLAARPRFTGMGAVTLNDTLMQAATDLANALSSNGCLTTQFAQCSTFQTAYNAAGGGNQTLSIDGLYGPATQSALQEVFDQEGGGTAPAACVAAHSASGGGGSSGGGTSTASLIPSMGSTVNFFGMQVSTQTLLLGGAAAVALGLVGAALYEHKHHPATSRVRYRTIRRRAPHRRRRRR